MVASLVPRSGELVDLVIAAQGGEASAFTALVVRFQRLVIGLAVGWLGDIELAKEAAQEAFLEAHLHLPELRDPGAFVPWLRRIVAKQCDRVTRRPKLPVDALPSMAERVGVSAPGPAEEVERRDEARAVRAALEQLPAHQRVVVALQYLGGYNQAEIARALDLPSTTVKKRAHDARLHLREELSVVRTTLTQQRNTGMEPFSDAVELFLAIRRGDAAAVRALLERRPELVEWHEDWPAEEAARARLPYAREGTALIRAAERGDAAIVRLLLDAGANVDGACGCAAGETPLWAAAASDYPDVVALLLERGADPNAPGLLGHTALHVAAMRGWPGMARQLLERGADPRRADEAGRTPLDWARLKGHADVVGMLAPSADRPTAGTTAATNPRADGGPTGDLCETAIKAIDLFAPIRHGDLVLVDGDYGLGLVVLLGELTLALRAHGYSEALWTGFEQSIITARELDHALGESGRRDAAELSLVPRGLEGADAREAFHRILRRWERRRQEGRRLLVVFEAEGQVAEVEAALPRLTSTGAGGATAIVVAPETFPPKGASGRQALPPGAACHLRFDASRARRAYYPAIDALASVSANLTPETVGAEHVTVAEDARRLLADYRRIDPELELPDPETLLPHQRTTAVRAQRLHAFLAQPFVFAEPFTGKPGLHVPRDAAVQGARLILDGAADAVRVESLRYLGGLRGLDLSEH